MSEESTKSWEGYSDYQTVSNSIARSIDEALEGYTTLESLHVESARIQATQAARARSKIKLAALKMVPELRDDAPTNKQYQRILARWHGGFDYDDENGETHHVNPPDDLEIADGYLDGLNNVQLSATCPPWLEQFAIDIRTAGWELGYLKAGRTHTENNLEPAEEDARAMFEA